MEHGEGGGGGLRWDFMKGFHYHDTLNNRVNHFLVGFRVKVRALMATSPVITGHGVRRGWWGGPHVIEISHA